MTTTLYAYIKLDTMHFGNRNAYCTATKLVRSHAEYASYKLTVDIPDSIPTKAVEHEFPGEIDDANPDFLLHATVGTHKSWYNLVWDIDTHRLYYAINGHKMGPTKGLHVKHWEEI